MVNENEGRVMKGEVERGRVKGKVNKENCMITIELSGR